MENLNFKDNPSKISNGMNYQEVVQQLEKRERYGFLFGLERINKFLEKLNHPEKNLQVIHITGTNGKGSTASFIAKILEFAGYQVGLYTSPHLIDIRERIQINGIPISKKDFLYFYRKLSTVHCPLSRELTYFEFLTALAFQYFFAKKIDFLILEVGMGGRFDATNVVEKPLVSLITNIDYEHTEYLGKTLKRIAYEKAGIIKRNSFLVTGVRQKNIRSQLEKICAQRKNRLFTLGEDFSSFASASADKRFSSFDFQQFDYRGIFNHYKNLRIKLLGRHQIENAALALATIEVLRLRNIFISEKAIREGLENTFWPGRLEIQRLTVNSKQLTVILDGAHNSAGMKILKDSLIQLKGSYLKTKKIFAILGILADKNISQMVKEICPVVDEVLVTKPNYYRAAEPQVIYLEVKKYLKKEKIFRKPTIEEALNFAFHQVNGKDTSVLVTGSLYTVGEAKKVISEWKKRKQLISV